MFEKDKSLELDDRYNNLERTIRHCGQLNEINYSNLKEDAKKESDTANSYFKAASTFTLISLVANIGVSSAFPEYYNPSMNLLPLKTSLLVGFMLTYTSIPNVLRSSSLVNRIEKELPLTGYPT